MNIILGPPGTGKTEYLLKKVEEYLTKGISPDKIGFFGFTRRSVNEAIGRACHKFGLTKSDLPFFKTLHSLAYGRIGIDHTQIMTEDRYLQVSDWLKLGKSLITKVPENEHFIDFRVGDKFVDIINYARIMQRPLREVFDKSTMRHKTDWSRVDYVDRGLSKWKTQKQLYDYTDMLEQFCWNNYAPFLQVVFVDEAQDLSPLQWSMIRCLEERSQEIFVAGDDDQAIFRFAGADVTQFINLKGDVTVLDQSFRMPLLHHTLSQNLIKGVLNRRIKQFNPKDEKGFIRWHGHSEEVDLSEGEWLLLSRTSRGAKQIEEEVRKRGYFYTYKDDESGNTRIMEAVSSWEKLRDGKRVSHREVLLIYSFMILGEQISYGFKTFYQTVPNQTYDMHDLLNDCGLKHRDPWHKGLGKISDNDKIFIKACLKRGESLKSKPRIRISTIHSAKGAQAENVMMLTDTGQKNRYNADKFFDEDEARVFYVGITRSFKNLHLIHPMYSSGYPIPQPKLS